MTLGLDDAAILELDDVVAVREPVRVVRDEDDQGTILFEDAVDALGDEVGTHLRVHRGEHIVEQYDGGTGIASAGEGDARLLPAREVDSALANLRLISAGQLRDVRVESAGGDDARVERGVVGLPEEDVVTQRVVGDPDFLRADGHVTADHHAAVETRHVADDRREERRLAAAHRPADADQAPLVEAEGDVDQRGGQDGLLRMRCRGVGGGEGRRARWRGGRAPLLLATLLLAVLALLLVVLRLWLGPLERAADHLDRRRAGLCGGGVGQMQLGCGEGREAAMAVVAVGGRHVGNVGDRALGGAKVRGEAAIDDDEVHQASDHHRYDEEREA